MGRNGRPTTLGRFPVMRKTARLVGPGRWGRWVVLVLLALVVSGFEAVGAVAIYALMALLTSPDQPLNLPVIGDLNRILPDIEQDRLITVVAIALGIFFVLRSVVIIGNAYLQNRIVFNAGARLSVRLLDGYLSMPYQFHLQRNSAELIRNAFDSVQVLVKEVLAPLARVISESLVILGLVAVLAVTAPTASLLALAVIVPSVAILLGLVHPRLKRMGAVSQEMSSKSLQSLAQSLEGVRDITILGRRDAFKREFARQRRAHARANARRNGAREIPRAALETLLFLFILAFFAITETATGGSPATLPVIGLFAYAALRLKPPLGHVMSGLNSVRFADAAIDQLYEDLVTIEQGGRATSDVEPMTFTQQIHVKNLSFAYQGSETTVLRGIDFTIPRGSFVGIVGPTGGGKSTLIDLLLGLLEPTTGQVLVDGVDMHLEPTAWQRHVGMVPQSVFLVDATLRHNICLGLADSEIDDDQLREAIRLAQLEGFVASLPNGWNTWVGERGVRISGGQRQRVAIARALYRQPAVLIFDEGTSALDSLTEAELIKELDQLRGGRTIITVAHRLSTVRSCDLILLLEDGEITDRGTYDYLIERNQRFRAMVGTP